MPYVFFDSTYLLLLPAILFALIAQIKVSSTFEKYSRVSSSRGLTGMDVARKILDENGLFNVSIERVPGKLTDHFDPKSNVVRLSDSVYGSTSVSAIGVAAHEVGHAIQYSKDYVPMKIRSGIIPLTRIGSTLSLPIFLIGMLFAIEPLLNIGIWLYVGVVAFQLVTLPVEFNASRRALATLENYHILEEDELKQSRKVLSAAALTYVAALFTALMSLFRLILLSNRRRR